nr:ROK family [uncultured bacterium]
MTDQRPSPTTNDQRRTTLRIGVDLGGTKIEVIALDGEGKELRRRRTPTPRHDYRATVTAIGNLVLECEGELGATATVGVGIPGAISPATGLVKNANSVWLNGRPLADDLAQQLARPIRLANDANCFALSEAVDGAGAGAAVVFGVIVGTGTGGGVVIDGRVVGGANAIAGEWGHNPLPWPEAGEWPGPPCYCGRRGCIETFLSGPGFERDYAEAGGDRISARDIGERAGLGERQALACLERYEDRMARGLASVINLLDPDVIVLGGGVSNLKSLYTSVPLKWTRFVFSDRVATRLVPAMHGDSSGVRGAAWLWEKPEGLLPSGQ